MSTNGKPMRSGPHPPLSTPHKTHSVCQLTHILLCEVKGRKDEPTPAGINDTADFVPHHAIAGRSVYPYGNGYGVYGCGYGVLNADPWYTCTKPYRRHYSPVTITTTTTTSSTSTSFSPSSCTCATIITAPSPPPPPPGPTCHCRPRPCHHLRALHLSAAGGMAPPPPPLPPCTRVPPSLRPRHRNGAFDETKWGGERRGGRLTPLFLGIFFSIFFSIRRTGGIHYSHPQSISLQFSHFEACTRLVFIFSGILVYLYILLIMNILRYYYTEKPMRLIKWVPATPAGAL